MAKRPSKNAKRIFKQAITGPNPDAVPEDCKAESLEEASSWKEIFKALGKEDFTIEDVDLVILDMYRGESYAAGEEATKASKRYSHYLTPLRPMKSSVSYST